MLYRKIEKTIEAHLLSGSDKILVVEGARQVGKSFIIREVGKRLFKNFVEVNFAEDAAGKALFSQVRTIDDFYFLLSAVGGGRLGSRSDTLVFLDEIQQYPQFLTLLKFLRQEGRFTYIASGSLLGVTLRSTTSIPVGSMIRLKMHQLDFEEFLLANGMGADAISVIRQSLHAGESLSEETHEMLMTHFRRYLLVGGMPDVVNEYLATRNIVNVRRLQSAILQLYKDDASKYVQDAGRALMVRRVYDMIPSQMENKKKRIVAKDIQGRAGDRFSRYLEEFEYLVSSGIALDVHAVSNPKHPLTESVQKNLLKLYLNDVGMLTAQLFAHNVQAVMNDDRSVNLGAVYESVVAQELSAHGFHLFYYDNRKNGEVDFLIDDFDNLSVLPIEVKSGRDYTIHSALNKLLSNEDYHVKSALVLSNQRQVRREGLVAYMPIYYVMFLCADAADAADAASQTF
ncbi:MAG: ATP-binding protein [Alloprevotella sp.]